jgi:AcrR family transcriptional regulator
MKRSVDITKQNGRPNQRRRTRKDLLQAAARLMKQGRKPSLEEVAAEALVSRATAYRYFPSIESLHLEAALDVATPQAEEIFRDTRPDDPVGRINRVDEAFDEMISCNEAPLRMMLVHSLERIVRGEANGKFPARQNRRMPLIEAALAPSRRQFKPRNLDLLTKALSLVIGTESMLVLRDVLNLNEAESRRVKRWVIRSLIEAAK